MRFDPELHHRRSTRLRGYDYSRDGLYFVTLCAAQREPLFAQIDADKVVLTDAGSVIQRHWDELPTRFAHVRLEAFIVMPDHCHGIVAIQGDGDQTCPPLRSLSAILRAYKSLTAIEVNRLRGTPGAPVWQSRFYDRIIRDETELERARRYIAENPARWLEGKDDTASYR